VQSAPGRKSKKAFGAVSLDSKPRFQFRFEEIFNTQTFQKFLGQIVRHAGGKKIFMIMDNAKYHHSKALQPWLAKNAERIELYFLPAYSPNLNPIERVWKKAKKASIHNRYFERLEDLHSEIFRRFNRFQGNPVSLLGCIQDFL
jgi:transposase